MINLNIRTMVEVVHNSLFPDYHEHMELMKEMLTDEIHIEINDKTDDQVYQYYSVSPLCYLEARWIKRMKNGTTVVYIQRDVKEYVEKLLVPNFMKRIVFKYLVSFLNKMDYLVVTDMDIIPKLELEGVKNPSCYWIAKREPCIDSVIATMWKDLYRDAVQGNA